MPASPPRKPCEWCGELFYPARKTSRTCSADCRKKHNTTEQNAKYKAKRDNARGKSRQCGQCQTSFSPARSDSWYCSNSCAQKAKYYRTLPQKPTRECSECGKDITELRVDANTCSSYCGGVRAKRLNRSRYLVSQQQREAIKRQATVGYGVPEREWIKILSRFNYSCYYCSEQNIKLTMDHIVPISRGGAHSIGNVAPACGSCNSSKGTKLLIEWRLRR